MIRRGFSATTTNDLLSFDTRVMNQQWSKETRTRAQSLHDESWRKNGTRVGNEDVDAVKRLWVVAGY